MIGRLFYLFLLIVALWAIPVFATHVAVLETISAPDIITLDERQYFTDVLRSEAVKVLTAEQNYTIMTRENINMMLPPGKTIEDCEGSCLVETGKNISADYVAQGHVGRFTSNLTITVELYETASNKLVASFSSKAPDIESLEIEIRQKSKDLFSTIFKSTYGTVDLQPMFVEKIGTDADLMIKIDGAISMDGNKFIRGPWKFRPGEHTVEFLHRCYEPQKFIVNVYSGKTVTVSNKLEPKMGELSIKAEYQGVARETPVYVNGVMEGNTPMIGHIPVCAKVEVGELGYRETVPMNWNNGDKLDIAYSLKAASPVDEDQRADSLARALHGATDDIVNARDFEGSPTWKKTATVVLVVLGLASVGMGVYENTVGNDERSKYDDASYADRSAFDDQWDKVQSARIARNIFYGAGVALIGAGVAIHFVF